MNEEEIAKSPLFAKMLAEADHWERGFQVFRDEFANLSGRNDAAIGRLLTCHLLVEYYLSEYLAAAYPTIPKIKSARLSFWQKMELVSFSQSFFEFVGGGIGCLNRLRNKLVHSLSFEPDSADTEEIRKIMAIWNTVAGRDTPDGLLLIEQFTQFSCMLMSGAAQDMRRRHASDGIIGLLNWYKPPSP